MCLSRIFSTLFSAGSLGAKVLDMFVLEYLHAKYPKMPTKMLQEAVATYTRTTTLAQMAKEFGVEDVARWTRSKVRFIAPFFLATFQEAFSASEIMCLNNSI